MSKSSQAEHNLTLIPGPIEFDDDVLKAMAHPSVGHTAEPFVSTFQSVLKQLRTVFFNKDPNAQAFVMSGGGTLGWDISAANFTQEGDDVLLLNTGFFSHSWSQAFEAYGANVTEIKPTPGSRPTLDEIEKHLTSKKFKVLTITQVDTSTAVLNDVKAIAALAKKVSPETLILVDGVCSVGVEELRFDEWGLDFVLTASQKALATPAGLCIVFASERALKAAASQKVHSFYGNLNRWLPVMQAYESGKPAYFSTPPVQTIFSLKASLDKFASSEESVLARMKEQAKKSDEVKDTLASLGIKLVAESKEVAAHGLTAAYLPENVALTDFLPWMLKHKFVLAGGILPPIQTKYFRIGHMGPSVTEYGHVDKLIELLPQAFKELSK